MSQKVIKIGSSLGITLPKYMLNKLSLKQGSKIDLEYNSRREAIEVRALEPNVPTNIPKSLVAAQEILSQYGDEIDALKDE